jgi:hypothetical protein
MHPLANGKTGYEAGVEICQSVGGTHPCEYLEIKKAEAAQETNFLLINPQNTVWIHRTTQVIDFEINHAYVAGPASRCNDWEYLQEAGDPSIADGEYYDPKLKIYHLDWDTTVPGPVHHPCKYATPRALPCCYDACVP